MLQQNQLTSCSAAARSAIFTIRPFGLPASPQTTNRRSTKKQKTPSRTRWSLWSSQASGCVAARIGGLWRFFLDSSPKKESCAGSLIRALDFVGFWCNPPKNAHHSPSFGPPPASAAPKESARYTEKQIHSSTSKAHKQTQTAKNMQKTRQLHSALPC